MFLRPGFHCELGPHAEDEDPFSSLVPPRTPGPLGRNDAGDPDAHALLGDTPGPWGVNDGAAQMTGGGGPLALRMLQKMVMHDPRRRPRKRRVVPPPLPKINWDLGVPTVAKQFYKYASFALDKNDLRAKIQAHLHDNGVPQADIDSLFANWQTTVEGKIKKAWKFITEHPARTPKCNNYFQTLGKGKTLAQILKDDHITIHCLIPKDGYTFKDVTAANTNVGGPDIGLHPDLLIYPSEKKFADRRLSVYDDVFELAGTLVHELAHVAGATTDFRDEKHGLDAENSLPPCGCGDANPENKG